MLVDVTVAEEVDATGAVGLSGGNTDVELGPPPDALISTAVVLGACAPPVTLALHVVEGAPVHGGHAADVGAGSAAGAPTFVDDETLGPVPPAAIGPPRIAPAPVT